MLQALALAALDSRDALAVIVSKHEYFQVSAVAFEPNFRAWGELVSAEIERLRGNDATALLHYADALEAARRQDNALNEALTYERMAGFWRQRGNAALATICRFETRRAYQRWGALGKVRDLEARHAELRSERRRDQPESLDLDAARSRAACSWVTSWPSSCVSASKAPVQAAASS